MFLLPIERKCWYWWKSSKYKVTVLQAINNRHFANNADLLQALKPIADAIGLLESPYTTIASIYLAMIQLYNLYTGVKCNKFADPVKTCLTKCFEQYFCHSIFPISIFLWPQYWDFSLSKPMVQIGWPKKWFNWLCCGILLSPSALQLTKVCKCILLPRRMISCLVLIQFHFGDRKSVV